MRAGHLGWQVGTMPLGALLKPRCGEGGPMKRPWAGTELWGRVCSPCLHLQPPAGGTGAFPGWKRKPDPNSSASRSQPGRPVTGSELAPPEKLAFLPGSVTIYRGGRWPQREQGMARAAQGVRAAGRALRMSSSPPGRLPRPPDPLILPPTPLAVPLTCPQVFLLLLPIPAVGTQEALEGGSYWGSCPKVAGIAKEQ